MPKGNKKRNNTVNNIRIGTGKPVIRIQSISVDNNGRKRKN